MVDSNDGTKMERLDLPFEEFDGTLRTNLDFKSESCVKALCIEQGVEDLRAILHYQMMQLQLMQIGTGINETLSEGAMRGLFELEDLTAKKGYTLPNPIISLDMILSKSVDGFNMDMYNKERARLKGALSTEAGQMFFIPNHKKSKHRNMVLKRYQNASQKVQNTTGKFEIKLKILKAFRTKLLHSYCKEVLKDAYTDSVKYQSLLIVKELRLKSFLLPRDQQLFELGHTELQELVSKSMVAPKSEHTVTEILGGRLQTLFYVPAPEEIMHLEAK